MDQRDRQQIQLNMGQLIQHTNYRVLMEECVRRRMLSEVMKAIIEDRYRDEATQHKKLFEKITKRGPMAFRTLLDICQHNFPIAYELLKNGGEYKSTYRPIRVRSVSAGDYTYFNNAEIVRPRLGNLSIGSQSLAEEDDPKNNNDTVDETGETCGEKRLLQEFRKPVRRQYQVELAVRRQSHRILEAYEMRKRNRGVVFIVNVITYINETHPTRNGAEADKDNLVSLFQQLGFTVFYYEDLTSDEFNNLVKELKQSSYLSTECFAFYILAHGNHTKGRDKIYLNDNSVQDRKSVV